MHGRDTFCIICDGEIGSNLAGNFLFVCFVCFFIFTPARPKRWEAVDGIDGSWGGNEEDGIRHCFTLSLLSLFGLLDVSDAYVYPLIMDGPDLS